MQLVVKPTGIACCIYGEVIDLSAIGTLVVKRASHVEPDDRGEWLADLSPVEGPILGPFVRRSAALAAEQDWLEANPQFWQQDATS